MQSISLKINGYSRPPPFHQQLPRRDSQRTSDTRNNAQRRVANAALDAADVRAMQARMCGEVFLRPFLLDAQRANVLSKLSRKLLDHPLGKSMVLGMQTLRLQTDRHKMKGHKLLAAAPHQDGTECR